MLGITGLESACNTVAPLVKYHFCQFHQILRSLSYERSHKQTIENQDRMVYSCSQSSCWPEIGLGLPVEKV